MIDHGELWVIQTVEHTTNRVVFYAGDSLSWLEQEPYRHPTFSVNRHDAHLFASHDAAEMVAGYLDNGDLKWEVVEYDYGTGE